MNRPNHPARELSRRQMLRLATAGVVGFSTSGWIEALAADAAAKPQAPESVHPALDDRRPEPDRHIRSQARPPPRRRVQGHRDGGPRHCHQRAPSQAGQADERDGRHPLDEHEGRGPRPGDFQPADRLPADRPDPLSDPGVARGQGDRVRRRGAAQLCQHRAGPLVQPWSVRTGISGTAICPAGRRRARGDGPARGLRCATCRSRSKT